MTEPREAGAPETSDPEDGATPTPPFLLLPAPVGWLALRAEGWQKEELSQLALCPTRKGGRQGRGVDTSLRSPLSSWTTQDLGPETQQ